MAVRTPDRITTSRSCSWCLLAVLALGERNHDTAPPQASSRRQRALLDCAMAAATIASPFTVSRLRAASLAHRRAVRPGPRGACSAQAEEPLAKLVIVMRDGTSVPTASATELANWAAQPWPVWNQAPGALDPAGRAGRAPARQALSRADGRVRGHARSPDVRRRAAPLSTPTCPPARNPPRANSSTGSRRAATRWSARSPARGGAVSRCRRPPRRSPSDPVFHPLEAGVCRLDPLVAQSRRARARVRRRQPLDAGPEGCRSHAAGGARLLQARAVHGIRTRREVPARRSSDRDVAAARWHGARDHRRACHRRGRVDGASSTSISRAWRPTDVAWGRAKPAEIRDVVRLSTEHRDLLQRTPYLARKRGSALLFMRHRGRDELAHAGLRRDRSRRARRVVRGLRGPRHQPVEPRQPHGRELARCRASSATRCPPGAALVFEVRENAKDKKLRVYTSFVAQNVEQLRKATPLPEESLPSRTPLRLPGCSSAAPGFPCTIEEFAVAMRNNIDRECVE